MSAEIVADENAALDPVRYERVKLGRGEKETDQHETAPCAVCGALGARDMVGTPLGYRGARRSSRWALSQRARRALALPAPLARAVLPAEGRAMSAPLDSAGALDAYDDDDELDALLEQELREAAAGQLRPGLWRLGEEEP